MPGRLFLIVMDSVGIGSAPDAHEYGDEGAATLPHIAQSTGGICLPTFESLGLANIQSLLPDQGLMPGVSPVTTPKASWGAMRERSEGKDTITGHWEIAGLFLDPGFSLFPHQIPAFPRELLQKFESKTGRKILGNCHGSGTEMINRFGEQAYREKAFICYTSADSVFQIAAHVDCIPLEELYQACKIARKLCDPLRIGRVIARPYRGEPGAYERTSDRVDYAFETEEQTILQHLEQHGIAVYGVGKIEDIFAQRGITESWHTGNNAASMAQTDALLQEREEGFVFANFIDFDMMYGHRRDPKGYAACLEHMDAWLAKAIPKLREGDVMILTADHGNDPTFKGTDHTREYVPLLVIHPGKDPRPLGIRDGFYDIAQSVASYFGVPEMPLGKSFL